MPSHFSNHKKSQQATKEANQKAIEKIAPAFKNYQFDGVWSALFGIVPLAFYWYVHMDNSLSGYGILLVPQTCMLHMAPDHYYNFTRYWVQTACQKAGLEIVSLQPLGGFWSTIASRLVYFFPMSMRSEGMSDPEILRPWSFYLLYPLMVLTAMILVPWCMLLSLGDLQEEPNNILFIVKGK